MSCKRYRAQCTICDFVSPQNKGPVFAAWHALKHSKNAHPDNEGIVSYVFEVPVQFISADEGKASPGSAIEGNAGKSLKPSEISQTNPPPIHFRGQE